MNFRYKKGEYMEQHIVQQLFDEPIEEIITLDPGYSGHASDVWLVKTSTQEVIVRSSRWKHEPDREFWWGCKFMFGIDPRHMIYFEENSKFLNTIPDIRAPKTLTSASIEGKEYLIVEKMKGAVLQSFTNQSKELLYQFGVWLAKVHRSSYDFYGNLARTSVEEKGQFHSRLAQAMRWIVEKEQQHNRKMVDYLVNILNELNGLPVPAHFCPILVDMDPSQFLSDNGMISAIVDTEAYVVAPRELDFVGLEYVMDKEASIAFINGYTTILDIPELSKCRKVYRYWYRLLGVQGSVDLDTWLAQPELF